VQNVESLAYAALIARHGVAWYRSAGRGQTPGTALVTVSGAVPRPGVREIEYGTTIAEVAALAGATTRSASAVLVGGYFGAWASLDEAWDRPLDPADRAPAGLGFGCGVVSFAGSDTCGVRATAEIMTFMAGQSAAQCGPCVFGLAAIAEATRRLASGSPAQDDLGRIDRWAGQVLGRGACHHPDGAVGLLRSALDVFADEFARHQARGRCSATRAEVA
jgi:NADH:ubiquinone oxidoreductase subunit F (NADH-binding)